MRPREGGSCIGLGPALDLRKVGQVWDLGMGRVGTAHGSNCERVRSVQIVPFRSS